MIDQDKRKAIVLLHEEGMNISELSRTFHISDNTVRDIIRQKGIMPKIQRQDTILIDPDLVTSLYENCNGRIQRVYEKLTEEKGIKVSYPTLSRIIRGLGLRGSAKGRCHRVPDEPGAEMQHDTSPYVLSIGGKKMRVIGSILYFRYSSRNPRTDASRNPRTDASRNPRTDAKVRYVKFYRSFNRFCMKCFFHEALTFFGYSAKVCIIDNTNLARLRGTGKDAVIAPEMEGFARQFGFFYLCHEKGHANRKAGNERSFWTVETNFFPGRNFESLEDLNKQAFEWATVRIAQRVVSKTEMIPAKVFEHEKLYLVKLPPFVPPPYLNHKRQIDQYGYIPFDGNFYWVPGKSRGEVTVLQYGDCLKIYLARELLAEYPLPAYGVKNQSLSPQGLPKPQYQPKHRTQPTLQEEKTLRSLDQEVDAYLQFILKPTGKEKHRIVRELFRLYQKVAPSVFIKTITRAHQYRITDIRCVERIASLQIQEGDIQIPSLDIDEQFQERQAFREGQVSSHVDLSIYEKMMEDNDDE